jgi:flagellin-like hook-associated protein FlgL
MTVTINTGAQTAAASVSSFARAANHAVTNIASGRNGSNGIQAASQARATSYGAGSSNMRIMAGRYEGYAGLANALHSASQEQLEIASKFSQTGYDTAEYSAAAARYLTLHDYMDQIIATVAQGTEVTMANAKDEALALGDATVAATGLARATITGTNTTAVGGNAGYAAVANVAAVNGAAAMAAILPALKIEVQNMAAHAADMVNASKMFQSLSLAAGFVAAGYSSQSESAGTDFAVETAKLAAAQIKAQAATAMVAQASVVDQAQLALLQ